MCFLTAWELSEFVLLREKKFQCFFKRVNDTFSVIFFKEPKVLPINLQIWIEYVDFIQRTKESGIFRTFTLTLNISELKRKHFRMSGDAFQMMIIIYGQSRRLERQMELWYAKGFISNRCKYDALAKICNRIKSIWSVKDFSNENPNDRYKSLLSFISCICAFV